MPANRSGSKGPELEELLRAYFWQAGYFVIRGVPYQIDGEDVTDIDLWLYERPAASSRRRIIVDIKNKKSPKAAERIIWTRGLQAAIGVDGAIVATPDNRPSMRRLGKSLGLQVLDKDAILKISQSDKLEISGQINLDDLNAAIKAVDGSRRSSEWKNMIAGARASVISGMGVQSANVNLAAAAFFAEQTVMAQPGSDQARIGLRLFYLTSAVAAISLDYVLSEQAFRSPEERKQIVVNAIRFGQSETVASVPLVTAAISLARKYADNGTSAAKQIEYGFYDDADRIPAEIIAEYLAKFSRADALFSVAREIERASNSANLPGLDQLGSEARSLLGVFLDFNGVAREKVALAWPGSASPSFPAKPGSSSFFNDEHGKA